MKKLHVHRFVAISAALAFLAILLAFLYSTLFTYPHKVDASTAAPITGWLWSDTIGWIVDTCNHTSDGTVAPNNTNTCGTVNYGLTVDSVSGVMSGYAWSDNVGWVSANTGDLSGCPVAPCTASISGANVSGWLKALSGNNSQNGGWDGFISLNDTNLGDGFSYGVTYSGGNFAGYAWGDKDVGWVDFSRAHTTFNTCSASTVYTCSGTQTIVRTDTDTSCLPTVTNTTCVAPQYCSIGIPTCLTPQPTDSPTGSLTGHLLVKPNLVTKNSTSTVYWNVNNVTNCTVVGTNATSTVWSGATSATSTCAVHFGTGCTTAPISSLTTYTLSCTALDSSNYKETATVNVLPDFQER